MKSVPPVLSTARPDQDQTMLAVIAVGMAPVAAAIVLLAYRLFWKSSR